MLMEQERRYCTILIKRRVSGEPGPPPMLVPGELAMNEGNSTLYVGTTAESLSGDQITDLGTF